MDYKDFSSIFCDILGVLNNAAPTIGTLVGSPLTGIIIGLLAAVTHCDACDHEKIAEALKNDPDLHTKLARLEKTHAKWLQSCK